ncbi:ABC-three component system protein [Pseudomonas sp. NMI760_13]|uniref:ABC-three component system protein n=1 Tax=Pseudomonas sp. NMI760_13 TaxID=2903147 RepID=UPI001E2A399C|nr:ABC-three component system protein [Pseudomonas sp. NMI760_13]MCE0917396.1 HNH endonuclease [Pseudomonas sp. NMI760_13]
MPSNKRKSFSENINIMLVGEVSAKCPKCHTSLMYEKANTSNKRYQLAHIYPLNPKPHELELLKNEYRLHADVDNPDNLIALCNLCHIEFDNPRTVQSYRDMVALKQTIMERNRQSKLRDEYMIESEISKIIDALEQVSDEDIELSLEPKELSSKINDTMSRLTRNRIKENVSNYFSFVRKKLQLVEAEFPDTSTMISMQVKTYYLLQKKETQSQQAIFKNIVEWIRHRSGSESEEASEIIASFFIQNCEIFE